MDDTGGRRMSIYRPKDEELDNVEDIKWINIIFLPFHPVFKIILLGITLMKCFLAPINSVMPDLFCSTYLNTNGYTYILKLCYIYVGDLIYVVDTFLHIVHRQVSDAAMRREHLPKPARLLLLDLLAVIPFMKIIAVDTCAVSPRLFPNFIGFTELFCLYRIFQHFELTSTHSRVRVAIGYTILIIIVINSLAWFLMLLTIEGTCPMCKGPVVHDWRVNYIFRFPEYKTNSLLNVVFSYVFILNFFSISIIDPVYPETYLEYLLCLLFIAMGFAMSVFVIVPKFFAEFMLRMRLIAAYHTRVLRIVNETKRRNPDAKRSASVEEYYSLIWLKRGGIIKMPPVIESLPRYLREDIKLDLMWPVFYHSPTLRNTSQSFKRYICEFIRIDFKLPGERFFTGNHCYTNLYYIKKGVVQFLSSDDSVSPLLSVTEGTIIGDICFFLPPVSRKVIVRCLDYCELYILSRLNLLQTLHKFPEDRMEIVQLTQERIEHARSLYLCKKDFRGKDRTIDEDIDWVKTRWWEISEAISRWKLSPGHNEGRCKLPAERFPYHCAKYIGQLVLCSEEQVLGKSVFAHSRFPWVLAAHSSFATIWHNILLFTVVTALFIYPPNMVRKQPPTWFSYFKVFMDIIYLTDICIKLTTSLESRGNVKTTVKSIVITHCKTLQFYMDIFSSVIVEVVLTLIYDRKLARVLQCNRLLKSYVLFTEEFQQWRKHYHPMSSVLYKVLTYQFVNYYFGAYIFYLINESYPFCHSAYLFGRNICEQHPDSYPGAKKCDQETTGGVMDIAFGYFMEMVIPESLAISFKDLQFGAVMIVYRTMFHYTLTAKYLSSLYLKYKTLTNYCYFVTNLKSHFVKHKIHPDLLKRLDRYLVLHWKYFNGMDIMYPVDLNSEPYDIYYRIHGEITENILRSCKLFCGSDNALIRDLAAVAKYLLMPKLSTVTMFGVKCKGLYWLTNGSLKCEYHDDNGELLKFVTKTSEALAIASVLMDKPSLVTYTAETDIELLHINMKDFWTILNRYENEHEYFLNTIQEFSTAFDQLFINYVKNHRDYQKKLREKVFHARQSVAVIEKDDIDLFAKNQWEKIKIFISHPDTVFMQRWMFIRSTTAVIGILSSAWCGGPIMLYSRLDSIVDSVCDLVIFCDICIKFFLPYYNKQGILISDPWKCAIHYASRSLIVDLLGALPVTEILEEMIRRELSVVSNYFVTMLFKLCNLYVVNDCFDYLADKPSINATYIVLLKWQVIFFILMNALAGFYAFKCVGASFVGITDEVQNFTLAEKCWLPSYIKVDKNVTPHQIQVIFAQALSLAQNAFYNINTSQFNLSRNDLALALTFIGISAIFWFGMCQSKVLLLLIFRSDSLFSHNIKLLKNFLNSERVDQAVLQKVDSHFDYIWLRTKGLDVEELMSDRIGTVFKQDLNYYFFKKTFMALDKLLQGGELLLRQLANIAQEQYFLPGTDIMREMDLNDHLYIVHRGKVVISQNGKFLDILTKGAIFGQLRGSIKRPVRITANAFEHTDIITIPVKQFWNLIGEDVKEVILHGRTTMRDYINLRPPEFENAYNTIPYILRGTKTIKLWGMRRPVEAKECKWYRWWLHFILFWWTIVQVFFVAVCISIPNTTYRLKLFYYYFFLDFVYLFHFIFEFFSMEVKVVNNRCMYVYTGWKRLTQWSFYLDTFSFLVPFMQLYGPFNAVWGFLAFRIVRVHTLGTFYEQFIKNCQSKKALITVRIVIVLLIIHVATCGWLAIGCRLNRTMLEEQIPEIPIPPEVNKSVDYTMWTRVTKRPYGCQRLMTYGQNDSFVAQTLVPTMLIGDYMVSLTLVTVTLTHLNLAVIVPLTLGQIYYKLFLTACLGVLELWLTSVTIGAIYNKFLELYHYDYSVKNLIKYLMNTGISKELVGAIKQYSKLLWQRQRGTWLPEMAYTAPQCLREDILGALYIHHLRTPPLFQKLPDYFLRQLVVRLKRIVIFPGKNIVEEGDIYSCIYFIHEGEVEKWYTDSHGETKMATLLSMNGYFGLIPGLFPNMPYQFSYYSRTVVDLIYLLYEDWQDLLDGYPDVKFKLYMAARKIKNAS